MEIPNAALTSRLTRLEHFVRARAAGPWVEQPQIPLGVLAARTTIDTNRTRSATAFSGAVDLSPVTVHTLTGRLYRIRGWSGAATRTSTTDNDIVCGISRNNGGMRVGVEFWHRAAGGSDRRAIWAEAIHAPGVGNFSFALRVWIANGTGTFATDTNQEGITVVVEDIGLAADYATS